MADENVAEHITTALEVLAPALASDGFLLRHDGYDEQGRVRVVLEARPGACHDCLVPDEMLIDVLRSSISAQRPHAKDIVTDVVLEKVGF